MNTAPVLLFVPERRRREKKREGVRKKRKYWDRRGEKATNVDSAVVGLNALDKLLDELVVNFGVHLDTGLADLPLGIGGLVEGGAKGGILANSGAGLGELLRQDLIGAIRIDGHGPQLLVDHVERRVVAVGGAQGVSHVADEAVGGKLEISAGARLDLERSHLGQVLMSGLEAVNVLSEEEERETETQEEGGGVGGVEGLRSRDPGIPGAAG